LAGQDSCQLRSALRDGGATVAADDFNDGRRSVGWVSV